MNIERTIADIMFFIGVGFLLIGFVGDIMPSKRKISLKNALKMSILCFGIFLFIDLPVIIETHGLERVLNYGSLIIIIFIIATIVYKKIKKYRSELAYIKARDLLFDGTLPRSLVENLVKEYRDVYGETTKTHLKLINMYCTWYYTYNFVMSLLCEISIKDMPKLHFDSRRVNNNSDVLLSVKGIPTTFTHVPNLGTLENYNVEERKEIALNKKAIIIANRKIWDKSVEDDLKVSKIPIEKAFVNERYEIDAEAIIIVSYYISSTIVEETLNVDYQKYLVDRIGTVNSWFYDSLERVVDVIKNDDNINYYAGLLGATIPVFDKILDGKIRK